MDPLTGKISHRAKYPQQAQGIKKLRAALDLFFAQFVRISQERCNQMFTAGLQAIYTMIKAKVELSGIEG